MTAPATRLWREALQHLDRLLELPADQRILFLDELGQSQPQLHSVLATLLDAEARAASAGFLEPRGASAGALKPGAQLGPYRIESPIGAGGMGEVWLATRVDGLYEGQVAIKTLHPYFGAGALRERFLREAQILGRLAHPNIARLLDAGSAADGSVYLVLEYVRGTAIDAWCDERKLGVEARLGLFLDVCAAVAQAHANLVVHRDIKPSNILVTTGGQAKLLDFGVAKLLETEPAAERAELTRMTGRIFTPEFAAPEQILGEPITTAADVYTLGVLLHLLLTGARPYGRTDNPVELERAVLHDEPARASQAAASGTAESAAARGLTPARLARALAGDLDNIVQRALRKAPAERYPSVLALADDVRRHLAHKPILARPEGVARRAAKFVRRHRLGVAASLLVVLAIGAAIAGVLWQAQVARIEARKATAIRDFLVGIFEHNSTSHPDGARAQQTTAAELLNQGAQRIRTGLADAPEVRTELLGVMARLYSNMEMTKDALPLLQERLATQRRLLGDSHPDVARTMTELAHGQLHSADYSTAERTALEAQKIFRDSGEVTALEYAQTFQVLGHVCYRTGRYQDGAAMRYFKSGYDIVAAHHPRDPTRLSLLEGMSRVAQVVGNHEESFEYMEDSRRLIESGAVEVDGIERGGFYQAYGDRLTWMSRSAEAERYMRKAVEEYEGAGGPDHPYVADGKRALGMMLAWLGRRAEAKELLQSALDAQERKRGEADPQLTAIVRFDLARVLLWRGELPAAEEHLQRVFDAWRVTGQPNTNTLIQLGRLHTEQGRFDVAARDLDGIDASAEQIFGTHSWMHATAINRLGELHLAQRKFAQAEQYFRRNDVEARDMAGFSPNRAAAFVGLRRIEVLRRDPRAVDHARELLASIESARARQDMPDEEAAAHLLLGVALTQAGKLHEAQPHLEQAVQRRERMDAAQSPLLAEARLYLAQQQYLAGQRATARTLFELAAQAHAAQSLGPQHRALLAQTRKSIGL